MAGVGACVLVGTSLLGRADGVAAGEDWAGTWRGADDGVARVLLLVDGYMSHTTFGAEPAEFHRTHGGPFEVTADTMTGQVQFDSAEAGRVGDTWQWRIEVEGDTLRVQGDDGSVESWQRVAEEAGGLTGVWRISGRYRNGELQAMPLRARRTLKVLSGSRFQWIAMNIESGEFSGTGGGTYAFRDGVYVEQIDFFSRDPARVGARLEFQAELVDGDWHHRGLSSRGDPIHEIWTRLGGAE